MHTPKLHAGADFPAIVVTDISGKQVDISETAGDADWKMIVVYRGRHCPLCTKYLNRLEAFRQRLADNGIGLAAVSADSSEQLADHCGQLAVNFSLYCGLKVDQMQTLGLFISEPRSEQETDHLFPEPGLFVVNADHQVQVVDISNNPFVRPELESLVSGLEWIRNPQNNYPIRGTHH